MCFDQTMRFCHKRRYAHDGVWKAIPSELGERTTMGVGRRPAARASSAIWREAPRPSSTGMLGSGGWAVERKQITQGSEER